MYNHAWSRVARRYLLEHPLCVECQRLGRAEAARCVDHVIAHRGDVGRFWDPANWQALCQRCHSRKTAREDGGFGNRRAAPRGGFDVNGDPLRPGEHWR